ncbi:hypothetical protein NQ317_014283 [Molorchus minor]|uniref:UDENN domain-containing protein n=1 Tax=Molorchus minor TaxID=1323400 RepID=A0ABQ9IU79_9CUCU|nr:hypothetical protein NQ317_014283 [Molorchus minor]
MFLSRSYLTIPNEFLGKVRAQEANICIQLHRSIGDTTAVLMHSSRTEDLREFLSAVYNAKIAEPGKKFVVPFNRGDSTFAVDVPRPFQLPSIPENRNLTEYFNAVDTHNMMVIFASMLYERRIIFTSKKLKRLSACVQSANDIIYPMIWQHIFIPVLPMSPHRLPSGADAVPHRSAR